VAGPSVSFADRSHRSTPHRRRFEAVHRRAPVPTRCPEHPAATAVCVLSLPPSAVQGRKVRCESPPEPPMNRYVAPLGFTLAAVWVVVVFVLVSGTH
jgi:hypothetical protein